MDISDPPLLLSPTGQTLTWLRSVDVNEGERKWAVYAASTPERSPEARSVGAVGTPPSESGGYSRPLRDAVLLQGLPPPPAPAASAPSPPAAIGGPEPIGGLPFLAPSTAPACIDDEDDDEGLRRVGSSHSAATAASVKRDLQVSQALQHSQQPSTPPPAHPNRSPAPAALAIGGTKTDLPESQTQKITQLYAEIDGKLVPVTVTIRDSTGGDGNAAVLRPTDAAEGPSATIHLQSLQHFAPTLNQMKAVEGPGRWPGTAAAPNPMTASSRCGTEPSHNLNPWYESGGPAAVPPSPSWMLLQQQQHLLAALQQQQAATVAALAAVTSAKQTDIHSHRQSSPLSKLSEDANSSSQMAPLNNSQPHLPGTPLFQQVPQALSSAGHHTSHKVHQHTNHGITATQQLQAHHHHHLGTSRPEEEMHRWAQHFHAPQQAHAAPHVSLPAHLAVTSTASVHRGTGWQGHPMGTAAMAAEQMPTGSQPPTLTQQMPTGSDSARAARSETTDDASRQDALLLLLRNATITMPPPPSLALAPLASPSLHNRPLAADQQQPLSSHSSHGISSDGSTTSARLGRPRRLTHLERAPIGFGGSYSGLGSDPDSASLARKFQTTSSSTGLVVVCDENGGDGGLPLSLSETEVGAAKRPATDDTSSPSALALFTPSYGKKLCRSFASGRGCKHGEKCLFSHAK
jgi:hypothetical protein